MSDTKYFGPKKKKVWQIIWLIKIVKRDWIWLAYSANILSTIILLNQFLRFESSTSINDLPIRVIVQGDSIKMQPYIYYIFKNSIKHICNVDDFQSQTTNFDFSHLHLQKITSTSTEWVYGVNIFIIFVGFVRAYIAHYFAHR